MNSCHGVLAIFSPGHLYMDTEMMVRELKYRWLSASTLDIHGDSDIHLQTDGPRAHSGSHRDDGACEHFTTVHGKNVAGHEQA